MAASLATLATAFAVIALGIAAVQIGAAVRRLQEQKEEEEASEKEPLKGQRPMLSGLYPAVNGEERRTGMPGVRWLGAAGGLVVTSLLLGLFPAPKTAALEPESVAILRARVDSLAQVIDAQRVSDSLAAVKLAATPARPEATTRATRAPVVAARPTPKIVAAPAFAPDSGPISIPVQ